MAYTTIDDGSEYFQTATYSGNSSTLAVVNDGNSNLQPDWVWVKRRNSSSTHALVDSSRGRAKSLGSEATDAEFNTSDTSKDLISFDTDGFTVGQPNQRNMNGNGDSFVAWQWKANGGTTSSNSDGDITATVQANTTAGFSIVTYTGNGNASAQTVGHGLGAECRVVIAKSRSIGDESWRVFHESVSQSGGGNLFLNGTSALDTSDPARITSTNTTTFTLDGYHSTYDALNENSATYLAYCFAEIKGYSKFGSYTGNGNADGAFVYTGFAPKFFMLKCTSNGGAWHIFDNERDTINPNDARLLANTSDAESTSAGVTSDMLSNGFKLRNSDGALNGSGRTFIYMAFAEHPFVSSKGVPTTAR